MHAVERYRKTLTYTEIFRNLEKCLQMEIETYLDAAMKTGNFTCNIFSSTVRDICDGFDGFSEDDFDIVLEKILKNYEKDGYLVTIPEIGVNFSPYRAGFQITWDHRDSDADMAEEYTKEMEKSTEYPSYVVNEH